MNEPTATSVVTSRLARTDNQSRATPRMPGSSILARGPLPLAYIYQPAPSATQSGLARTKEWGLEFEPWVTPEIEPLMGWTSSRDPFAPIRLRFPDRQSAIEFAERHGWRYVVQEPALRRLRPKSYADNFRYDVAGAIARADYPWIAAPSITKGRTLQDATIGGRTGLVHRASASEPKLA